MITIMNIDEINQRVGEQIDLREATISKDERSLMMLESIKVQEDYFSQILADMYCLHAYAVLFVGGKKVYLQRLK